MKFDRRLTRLLGASWLTVGALSVTGIAASSLLQSRLRPVRPRPASLRGPPV